MLYVSNICVVFKFIFYDVFKFVVQFVYMDKIISLMDAYKELGIADREAKRTHHIREIHFITSAIDTFAFGDRACRRFDGTLIDISSPRFEPENDAAATAITITKYLRGYLIARKREISRLLHLQNPITTADLNELDLSKVRFFYKVVPASCSVFYRCTRSSSRAGKRDGWPRGDLVRVRAFDAVANQPQFWICRLVHLFVVPVPGTDSV